MNYKLMLIFIFIFIFSACSENYDLDELSIENNLGTENVANLRSENCDPAGPSNVFNPSTALFPNNIIEINPGDDFTNIMTSLNMNPQVGVTLYFKAGTHLFDNSGPTTDLYFNNFTGGLELVGDGKCTIIRQNSANQVGDPCSVRLIYVKNSSNIKIHNLLVDGNRDNLCTNNPGEGGNNIRIRNSEDILIEDICSINANGDALNIGCSDNIIVQDNYFNHANRNGLTLGWNGVNDPNPCISNNLTIKRNTFGEDIDTQLIDFEHASSYSGVQIISNDFLERATNLGSTTDQYAIAISKFDKDDHVANIVASNSFNKNRLTIRSSESISIRFNDDIGQTRILNGNTNIVVRGNTFTIEPTQVYAPNAIYNQGLLIRKTLGQETTNIQINNNEFNISNFERGIEIRNAKDIQVKNNIINNITSNGNELYGIRLRAEFADFASAYLTGNTITNWPDEVIESSTGNSYTVCTGNNCD